MLANIIETIDDEIKFVIAFFRSYENMAKAVVCGEKIEDDKKFFHSLKKILGIISKYSLNSLVSFLGTNSIQNLLKFIFIDCTDSDFVEHSIIIFQKLRKIPNCFNYVYDQCTSLLNLAFQQGNKTSGFWDIFSDQVANAKNDNRVKQLVPCLLERLKNQPSEINSMNKDEILCGLLKVLKPSWAGSETIPNNYHIQLILQTCLCEIPDGRLENSIAPPKCKHPETRSSGFELLLELCKCNSEFLQRVTRELDYFHLDPS